MNQNTIYVNATNKILDTKVLVDELQGLFEDFTQTCVTPLTNDNFGECMPKIRERICKLQGNHAIVREDIKVILRLSKDYLNYINDEEFPSIYGRVVKLRSIIQNKNINDVDGILYTFDEEVPTLDISKISVSSLFGDMLDKINLQSNELREYLNVVIGKMIEKIDYHSAYPDVDFRGEFSIEQVYSRQQSWNLLITTYCELLDVIQIMVEHTQNNIVVLNNVLNSLANTTVEL